MTKLSVLPFLFTLQDDQDYDNRNNQSSTSYTSSHYQYARVAFQLWNTRTKRHRENRFAEIYNIEIEEVCQVSLGLHNIRGTTWGTTK